MSRYQEVQIEALLSKSTYNKCSARDVDRYMSVLEKNSLVSCPSFLSIGSRSGTEIDLFKLRSSSKTLFKIASFVMFRKRGFQYPFLRFILFFSGGSRRSIRQKFLGLDLLNVSGRSDIIETDFHVFSDAIDRKFDIIHMNCLDHAHSPKSVAYNILRSLNDRGFLVLCFPSDQEVSELDPTANLSVYDIVELFPSLKLIYFKRKGSDNGYCEYIFCNEI